MTPGHSEPNLFEMRKKVEDLTRQLANDKRALADREKAINRDTDDDAFAREMHALLCLSVICQGWSDSSVQTAWRSFATALLMPDGGKRLERSQLLDLAGEFASNPFYQSIRSAQLLMAGGPGDLPDAPATDLVPEPAAALFAEPLFSEPDPGPAPASQEPTQPAAAVGSPPTQLLELTDDDIPF